MFKYIFIFFLFFSNVQAQINNQSIVGSWTKVKEQAIDGSKNISARFGRSNHWQISTTKINMKNEMIYVYINKDAIDYIKDGNHLSTSPDSGYNIVKLTSDSLVVVENIKGKIDKDKVQKIWFVKTSKIISSISEKYKNDSVLTATSNYTPILKKDFLPEVKTALVNSRVMTNFAFTGKLIISPKKKTIQLKTDDSKISGNKNFLIIKEIVEKSFANWDLTDFQNFSTIYIPYSAKSIVVAANNATNFGSISMGFFGDPNDDKAASTEPSLDDLEQAQKHMQKAVNFLQSKKYDKAVEFFNKGFALDPTKVDALYNIVSIYSFLKDKDKMCLTLKKLKDLEQTDGTKLYNQFCVQ